MTTRPTHSGFEPRTHDAERRDFFDLRRKLATVEGLTTGSPWDFKGTIPTPGPPTTAQDPLPNADGDMWIDVNGIGWVWNGTTWVNVGSIKGPAGPPGAQGPTGPQGATGPQGPKGDPGGFIGSALGLTIIDGGTATSPGDSILDCGTAA